MGDVNTLSAAAFQAIAVAQATYGVPDRLIAKIAQCSYTQVYRNRVKSGWSVLNVSTASMRGETQSQTGRQAGGGFHGSGTHSDDQSVSAAHAHEGDADVLRAAIDRLLLRLTREMAVEEVDEIDALALKRIELIGNAAKQVEKLVEMRGKLNAAVTTEETNSNKDPSETARVLKKIEKRVHDLAERRARDIINGTTHGQGSGSFEPGVDDLRPPKPVGNEPA